MAFERWQNARKAAAFGEWRTWQRCWVGGLGEMLIAGGGIQPGWPRVGRGHLQRNGPHLGRHAALGLGIGIRRYFPVIFLTASCAAFRTRLFVSLVSF